MAIKLHWFVTTEHRDTLTDESWAYYVNLIYGSGVDPDDHDALAELLSRQDERSQELLFEITRAHNAVDTKEAELFDLYRVSL